MYIVNFAYCVYFCQDRLGGEVARTTGGLPTLSRRDRVRAATTQEIKQVARRILVEEGPDGVSLRAIAREMGITAKFVASAREFRRWSLGHPREFALLFGAPLPGIDFKHTDIADECGRKFSGTFLALYIELWNKKPFPVPAPEDIDPSLRVQLERYRDSLGANGPGWQTAAHDLPVGALLLFLYCWVRLYGMVSLEVFGHLGWVLDDAEGMFEMMLKELLPILGLQDSAPR